MAHSGTEATDETISGNCMPILQGTSDSKIHDQEQEFTTLPNPLIEEDVRKMTEDELKDLVIVLYKRLFDAVEEINRNKRMVYQTVGGMVQSYQDQLAQKDQEILDLQNRIANLEITNARLWNDSLK